VNGSKLTCLAVITFLVSKITAEVTGIARYFFTMNQLLFVFCNSLKVLY
jgi:hypothetical protein